MRRHLLRRLSIVTALVLTGFVCAEADDDLSELKARILSEQSETERRVIAFNRVRIGHPQKLSVGAGWMFTRQPKYRDCRSVCPFDGWMVQVEPGWSGGQLAVGYGSLRAETTRGNRFVRDPYLGWGVKGALLRSWNGADLSPSNQTLLGIEGEYTVIQLNFSLGVYKEIGPERAADDWIVGGGFGWGF